MKWENPKDIANLCTLKWIIVCEKKWNNRHWFWQTMRCCTWAKNEKGIKIRAIISKVALRPYMDWRTSDNIINLCVIAFCKQFECNFTLCGDGGEKKMGQTTFRKQKPKHKFCTETIEMCKDFWCQYFFHGVQHLWLYLDKRDRATNFMAMNIDPC